MYTNPKMCASLNKKLSKFMKVNMGITKKVEIKNKIDYLYTEIRSGKHFEIEDFTFWIYANMNVPEWLYARDEEMLEGIVHKQIIGDEDLYDQVKDIVDNINAMKPEK